MLVAASCTGADDASSTTPAGAPADSTEGAPGATVATSAVPSNIDVNQYIATGGDIPGSSAGDPTGNFRLLCQFSHLSYDDPIMYPGVVGASHLHMFFGNTKADANSTYESLRTSGDGTCMGGPVNRSAYWSPAVLNGDGKVVIPKFISVYYKDGIAAQVGRKVTSMPAGLRMISGFDMIFPGPDSHMHWNCERTGEKTQTIPVSCPDDEFVEATVRFPTCWDGTELDSLDHRSHMAFYSYTDHGPACPDAYPVMLPELTVSFFFAHQGSTADWYVSSDRMPGMTHDNGSTFHADWFGAWDPTIQDEWVRQCINALRSCSGGQLGDGTWLVAPKDYAGPPLVDPPPQP